MNLKVALGISGVLVAWAGTVLAEDNAPGPSPQRFQKVRVAVDEGQAEIIPHDQFRAHHGATTTLFLNRCPGGCTIRSGWDSSINNTSSIISGTRTISQFSGTQTAWNAIVACVADTYAPFGITVTDIDPGNTPHFESIVAGTPSQAGFGSDTIGVAPFNYGNCGVINNSINFNFANLAPSDVQELCWTIAQESAHTFGLEHEALAADPMTYIDNGSYKRFTDTFGRCGEYSADPNGCDCYRNDDTGMAQNSYQSLLQILGSATPTSPVVTITSPQNGEAVEPGFVVRAAIDDPQSIVQVTLQIDGSAVETLTAPPWDLATPAGLDEGSYQVTVIAIDSQGSQGSESITVVVGEPCETAEDCADMGDDLTCVGGRCVPGEDADGGLGDTCDDDAQCLSGRCDSDTEGNGYCTERCDAAGDCPDGFDCISAGVCWPGSGDDGIAGGCSSSTGAPPALPIAFGVAVGALILRRRRRR